VRRHLRRVKRRIEMRLGEFLRAESEGEILRRENGHRFLADNRLAAARGSGDHDNLGLFQRVEGALNERAALQMEVLPDVPADGAQRETGMPFEGAQDLLLVRSDRCVPLDQRRWQIRATECPSSRRRSARLYKKGVPGNR